MSILMPCCLWPLTTLGILAPRRQTMALSTTAPRPLSLLDLPREVLDEILAHLISTADLACLALSHQIFLDIYRNSRWEYVESLHGDNTVRLRLDRDLPVLYHCARCNCANIPCLSHSLENITILSPVIGLRADRCQHNAYMGYIEDQWEGKEHELEERRLLEWL